MGAFVKTFAPAIDAPMSPAAIAKTANSTAKASIMPEPSPTRARKLDREVDERQHPEDEEVGADDR